MSRAPALAAQEIGVEYPGGVQALTGIDLTVAPGETLALVGESGSGKSTLLRLFNRQLEPTRGRIVIDGRPATSLDPIVLRRQTGYVQQDGGLLPHWTVRRNVALVPGLLGWPRERIERRTGEVLEAVGLSMEQFAGRLPHELSGGQRQRVAFARALAAEPSVVLLDEPFGALDALIRRELQDHFLDLRRTLGATMILVTHDLGEAFRLADRVGVLRDGRLLRLDQPDALRDRPGHPYVEALLALATPREGGAS